MSESTRHTLGPWTFDGRFCTNDGAVAVTGPHPELGKTRIALVDIQCKAKRGHGWETPCPERDANARLIAAAPEMLEALEGIDRELCNYSRIDDKNNVTWFGQYNPLLDSNVQRLRAAIRKARGSHV